MKTIYLITSSHEDWQGSTCFQNHRAFLTNEKAEQFIADYEESKRLFSRKCELTGKWKRQESRTKQPVKDMSFHRTRENLYKAKSLSVGLDVDSHIETLNAKIKEIDEAHKVAILEYERNRLAKKDEFALTLSEEDRAIFLNDNITKPEDKYYDIEELELEE